jgi:hypothetical protein
MTNLDQFESAFKAADKAVFHPAEMPIDRVLVVTDLDLLAARSFTAQVQSYLSVLGGDRSPEWHSLPGEEVDGVPRLLDRIESESPDLIVTYRHLHSDAWRWPYSLGEYLDVLTQATDVPVLVVPHPDANQALPHSLRDTRHVMAITDRLTGDDRLVSAALRFTESGGTCWLAHIEDDGAFDRTLEVIGKLPEIDTTTAGQAIRDQLFREPTDYIEGVRRSVEERGVAVAIEGIVRFGHRLTEVVRLIEEHHVDLVVFHTKDEEQMAMHGLAYPLAIELRQIPLLLL